jgi:hypothetical protein
MTSGYITDFHTHPYDFGALRVIFTPMRVVLTRYVLNYLITTYT